MLSPCILIFDDTMLDDYVLGIQYHYLPACKLELVKWQARK